MKLFDAHCHLPEGRVGSMLERAAAADVAGIAVCGTNPNDWVDCIDAHNKFQGLENPPLIFPMVGIHPWFVDCGAGSETPPKSAVTDHGYRWKERFQTLEKLLRDFPNLGIGETGLDFSAFAKAAADKQDPFRNRMGQEACFAAHLDLAEQLNRPVAVHCVKAWGRLIEILKEHPAPRIVLHAFSGAVELIDGLAERNCWFSFCGNVTNPRARRVRAAAAAVPAERLLIETDSPDFPPLGCSAPNEPANLIHVARAVAELRNEPVEAVAGQTVLNARSIYSYS